MNSDFKQSLSINPKSKKTLGKLILLSGISGCGKNYIADILVDRFNFVLIDKYVTRPFRQEEIAKKDSGKSVGIKSVWGDYNDGEKSTDKQKQSANARKQAFLNLKLPFSYINYGNYYGFSHSGINNYLENGRDVAIIVNDISIIRDLKMIYSENCLACYVYRVNPNNKEIFMQIANNRHDTPESAEKRHRQAVKDFNTYSNNISVYDSTILNTDLGSENLYETLENLMATGFENKKSQERVKTASPKVYAYIGNPGSGKDDVLDITRVQSMLHSLILPKCADRLREETDGIEMICRNDPNYDMDSCDIQYINFGTTYGINTKKIDQRLHDGISSCVVASKEDALNKLKQKYKKDLVTIYIQGLSKQEYAIQNKDRLNSPYVQKRIAEYNEADLMYQRNISNINHVIINTGDTQDLKLQIDNITSLYNDHSICSIQDLENYMRKANYYIQEFTQDRALGK